MTRSAKYFKTSKTLIPLYEGRDDLAFRSQAYEKPRYWVSERELRASFLKKRAKRIGLTACPKNLNQITRHTESPFAKLPQTRTSGH